MDSPLLPFVGPDDDASRQDVKFCTTSDGVRIAYATVGEGLPLVKAPNWLTHLEYDWETPFWREWGRELAKDFKIIRFDQRGCGLSDWNVSDISFEAWIHDLEAVADAAGLERFSILGISQGGAAAIAYAARHPERVSKLVLYGSFYRGRLKRGMSPEEHDALLTLVRNGWGRDSSEYRQLFTFRFLSNATAEEMRAFSELQRRSATPENAERTLYAMGQIDVTHYLPQVRASTLVLHARGEQAVPFDEGRTIASFIPSARLVTLDSSNHLMRASEPAWTIAMSEIRAFLSTPTDPKLRAPRGQLGALSAREVEVLSLLAAGKSNAQIAEALVITQSTVAKHVTSILAKTESANRTEAAAFAHRHGFA